MVFSGTGILPLSSKARPDDTHAPHSERETDSGFLQAGAVAVSLLTKEGLRSVTPPQHTLPFLSESGEKPVAMDLWEMAVVDMTREDTGLMEFFPEMAKGPSCSPFIEGIVDMSFYGLSMSARSARYRKQVEEYALKYNLDVPLVLAIMQAESGFDPSLISPRNAHGLMQIVPATAGGEVRRWLGGSGNPSSQELLNPDINIRYGTAYLHLLRTRHFQGVHHPLSLEYCMIAAYNGGSGALLRHFGSTPAEAVAAINRLSPHEVLDKLLNELSSRETRAYVRKVLDLRTAFAGQATRQLSAARPAPVPAAQGEPQSIERQTRQEEEADIRTQLERLRRFTPRSETGSVSRTSI